MFIFSHQRVDDNGYIKTVCHHLNGEAPVKQKWLL